MLNSWFSQKHSNDEADSQTRRSTEPRSFSTKNRPSASTATDVPPQPPNSPKPVFSTITTPHDTVLSRLTSSTQNPAQQGGIQQENNNNNDPNGTQPNFSPNNSGVSTGSAQSTPRPPQPGFVPEPLQDPFDGFTLGVLLPQDPSADARYNDQKTEEMWTHLSRVLELQGEIATMHMDMEGIRLGKAGDTKSKGRGTPTSGSVPNHPPVKPSRFESTLSQLDPAIRRAHERDGEDGVDVPDEEAEQNRIREEQFARLADQFEGRKEAINDIMDKLENLSEALTEFNALPVPKIEFPSTRHDAKLPEPIASSNEANSSNRTTPMGPSYPNTPKGNLSSSGILPRSLSRSKPSQAKAPHIPVPPVIMRPMDGTIPHLFDSPVSTIGSLKLPPED